MRELKTEELNTVSGGLTKEEEKKRQSKERRLDTIIVTGQHPGAGVSVGGWVSGGGGWFDGGGGGNPSGGTEENEQEQSEGETLSDVPPDHCPDGLIERMCVHSETTYWGEDPVSADFHCGTNFSGENPFCEEIY